MRQDAPSERLNIMMHWDGMAQYCKEHAETLVPHMLHENHMKCFITFLEFAAEMEISVDTDFPSNGIMDSIRTFAATSSVRQATALIKILAELRYVFFGPVCEDDFDDWHLCTMTWEGCVETLCDRINASHEANAIHTRARNSNRSNRSGSSGSSNSSSGSSRCSSGSTGCQGCSRGSSGLRMS
jgi:uncharacterized membrane protein YgcG